MAVSSQVIAEASIPQSIEILHILPARLRCRVWGLRHQPAAETRILDALGGYPGILVLKVSAWTGTALVEFDTRLRDDEIPILLDAAVRGTLMRHERPDAPAAEEGPALGRLRHWLERLIPGNRKDATEHIDSPEQPWHAMGAEQINLALATSSRGLQRVEAERRLEKIGRNVLPSKPPRSLLALFLSQLNSVPVLLLILSSAVSFLTGGLVDAAVIFGVVMINASLGCATEKHAERTISTLTRLDEPEAPLMRDGRVVQIDGAEIVPGDILLLSRGAYIPADARILECRGLTVAESALTGESAAVAKETLSLAEESALGDRRNMVYRGTVVTGGSGISVVVETGPRTEIGKIHALISNSFRPETPMERQLDRLGRQTAYAAGAVCIVTLLFGWLRGLGLLESLRAAVSLAVAALPEGLPTMSTTALGFGMQRMRQHNVLARNLSAVEAIGAIDLLCLDKTGTLTANRMAVVEVCAGGEQITLVPQMQFSQRLDANGRSLATKLDRLLAVCALCSEVEVASGKDGPEFTGSATEVALLEVVAASGGSVLDYRRRFPLLELQARTEERNFMITVHSLPKNRRLVAIKGSPHEVLTRCTQWVSKAGTRVLVGSSRKRVLEENERLASKARRVLGFAFLETDEQGAAPEQGFTWLGLVGMIDPPREGVTEALAALHGAGIETRMVTGDQRTTAFATAKDIGLWEEGEQVEVFDASQAAGPLTLTPELLRSKVFSRVSPSQKLEIVQALQARNYVVGMTGDGINDGPALKAADVGIALGAQSTETARESADLILRNDDLRSLVAAVREGRAIHNNIRQAVRFLITTNVSEVFSVLGSVAMGLGQPLTPRQLLWLNLVTDIFPVLSLAVEPAHEGILLQPPPDSRQPLLARSEFPMLFGESGLMAGAVALSYGYALRRYGSGRQATTMAFFSLTTAQLLHTLTTRSNGHSGATDAPPNKYIPLAVCGGLLLEAITMLPPFRYLLGLGTLSLLDTGVCLGSVATSSLSTLLLRKLVGHADPPAANPLRTYPQLTVSSSSGTSTS